MVSTVWFLFCKPTYLHYSFVGVLKRCQNFYGASKLTFALQCIFATFVHFCFSIEFHFVTVYLHYEISATVCFGFWVQLFVFHIKFLSQCKTDRSCFCLQCKS